VPGTYNQNFEFAPGFRSTAVEPELLARKHFGWPGLGAYFDGLFRWNRTTGNDQYMTTIGLFQQIRVGNWMSVTVTCRRYPGMTLCSIPTRAFPIQGGVREITISIEAGFSYTTSKRHIRYGFETRTGL